MPYRMFSSILGLFPLDASMISPKLWQPKMSPNALGGNIAPNSEPLTYLYQSGYSLAQFLHF